MIKTITSFFITLLCVIGTVSLRAEDRTALTVSLTDNTKVQFFLSDQPTMVPKADSAVFASSTTRIAYLRSSIDKFYFEKVVSSIAENKGNTSVSSQVFSDYVLLSSDSALPMPSVYNIVGMKFPAVVTRISDNEVKISIADLPKGLYIISVKKQSFKFLKK